MMVDLSVFISIRVESQRAAVWKITMQLTPLLNVVGV